MFDSNKTWFCKQLRTKDAKQISEQLNIAISEADHSEATKLFQKVKKYMKILLLSLWELIAFLLNYSMK